MAYEEDLANRVREALAEQEGVSDLASGPERALGPAQGSGISRPNDSSVTPSGSGPPRRPVSRPSIAAISSPES